MRYDTTGYTDMQAYLCEDLVECGYGRKEYDRVHWWMIVNVNSKNKTSDAPSSKYGAHACR